MHLVDKGGLPLDAIDEGLVCLLVSFRVLESGEEGGVTGGKVFHVQELIHGKDVNTLLCIPGEGGGDMIASRSYFAEVVKEVRFQAGLNPGKRFSLFGQVVRPVIGIDRVVDGFPREGNAPNVVSIPNLVIRARIEQPGVPDDQNISRQS